MKKSLIALAALAATASFAQSSVEIWGVVDAGLGSYKASDDTKATKLTTSNLSSSQLGFRGVEDLGGGLKAAFWMEAGLNPDSGLGQDTNRNNQAAEAGKNTTATTGSTSGPAALTFNRRSTLSLAGSFGEVRLGRDYTPDFWNKTVFDPFGTLGVAQASNLNLTGTGAAGVRASNGVSYLYGIAPNGGSHGLGSNGVYAQLTMAQGENTSGGTTSKDGNYAGARVGFANQALNVAFATGTTKDSAVRDYKVSNLGVSYKLPMVTLIAQVGTNKSGDDVRNNTTTLIGAQIPVGNGYIPVSFTTYESKAKVAAAATAAVPNPVATNGQKATQLGIGYVYNLSKRTALYANFASISNKDGASFNVAGAPSGTKANGTSSGYEAGVRHSF